MRGLGNWRVRTRAAGLAGAAALVVMPAAARAASYGSPEPVGSGFHYPAGVAVDGAGNVFVSDPEDAPAAGRVVEIASDGTQTTLASDFSNTAGLAVDSADNVFVADPQNNRVVEVAADGTETTIPVIDVSSVAVDSADDLYLARYDGTVVEVAADGTQTTVASGFSAPRGIALDAAGDVYVADTGDQQIVKIAPDGTQTIVGSGLSSPFGVAVDSAGDVFVANTGVGSVVEITPDGTQTTIADGLENPSSVAVTAEGNVFVADTDHQRVVELPIQHPTARASVTVTCAKPTSGQKRKVNHGTSISLRCTATVAAHKPTSHSPVPTGSVTFTAAPSDQPGEAFSPMSCTLAPHGAKGRCTTAFQTAAPGKYAITSTYSGDAVYEAATGHTTLKIK
jgi:sugar lactone lactonase YvrE